MKILVIPSWYPPNGGRFFKFQAEALAKLGHDVDVLILEEKGLSKKVNTKIESVNSILVNEIRARYYRIPKLNSLNVELYIRKYKKMLLKYLETNLPDVIHVQSSAWAGIVVSEISFKFNIPYVVSEQKSIFFHEKFPFNNIIESRIASAFDKASGIIANSGKMKIALSKYSKNEIVIIPNLVDVDIFKLSKNKKNKNFTFITVGNLIPVKGYDILIKAFSEILKHNDDVFLSIVGKGKESDSLMKLSKDYGIEKFIDFKGYKTKEELVLEYNNSTAYISSSRMETFGMTLIEAMSCGLPVVATKSGGPNDIVNETNGYLAEVENASSLQANMQLMIDNIANFDAAKIRASVVANYSEKVVSEALEKQLKNVTKIN